MRFLARFRQPQAKGGPPATYEIACVCDMRLSGARGPHEQVVRCPRCGRENFVLPQSPLPPIGSSETRPTPASRPRPARRFLIAAIVGTFLLIGGGVVLVWSLLHQPASAPFNVRTVLDRHRDRGQTALGDGNFQVAASDLRQAMALAERHPTLLTPAEFRELTQLHRQSSLLADLLHEPLAVLLQLAEGVPDQEWQVVFARNYHNKAVIFDTDVHRTGDGQYEMRYVVWDGRTPARLHLEEVQLLNALSLERPQRLIFGVRLADIRREPSGQWRIRLVSDSGVLLTEAAAVEACLLVPADDALREVLDRQATWLSGQP